MNQMAETVNARAALKEIITKRQSVAKNMVTLQASVLAAETEITDLKNAILCESDPKALQSKRNRLKDLCAVQAQEISIVKSSITTMQTLAREFQALLDTERQIQFDLRTNALNEFLDRHDAIFLELETLKNAIAAAESTRAGVCDPLATEIGFENWPQVTASMSPIENQAYENLMRQKSYENRG